MAKKLVKLVTVVNGDVLEEIVAIGCIVAYPQRLSWGMMDVRRYSPDDNTLDVIPERGAGTIQTINADHVVLLHHPNHPIPREFELLFSGGEFPAKVKSLYLDVIKEKEPNVYEQLCIPDELRDDDKVKISMEGDAKINMKICDTCGAEFESKAHNVKYCPDHRSKKARDAYAAQSSLGPVEQEQMENEKYYATQDAAKTSQVVTTPVDLSQIPTNESPVEKPPVHEEPKFITVDKGDTLFYKGNRKYQYVVLDVLNSGTELELLRLDTRQKGVTSAAIENWVKASAQDLARPAHQPVNVISAIEIIAFGGVPSHYQGKGITVASVKVRKNNNEYTFMINNSRDYPGTLYVRHNGSLNEVEEKEILAAYSDK